MFDTWRYHAFITNTTLSAVEADAWHRKHAVVEQVIAELKAGPLTHLPSGKCAIGLPVSSTIRTAPSRNSRSYLFASQASLLLIADASTLRGEPQPVVDVVGVHGRPSNSVRRKIAGGS